MDEHFFPYAILLKKKGLHLELTDIISAAVKRKKPKHGGMYDIAKSENRPMILIGG